MPAVFRSHLFINMITPDTLHDPFDSSTPASGAALEIVPGLRWIRMDLPFALDHINVWLLRDRLNGQEGWTLIDCGIANDKTRALWENIFNHGLDDLPILRIIVTHMHPDHIGLAHELCQRWNCSLWTSHGEYTSARIFCREGQRDLKTISTHFTQHFAQHGLAAEEQLDRVRNRGSYYSSMVPEIPNTFKRIMDKDLIFIGENTWEVHIGYGHSPEHVCLFCKELNIFISGDMVLPRISTNISVFDSEPEANPLKLYLSSLNEFKALPENTLVLPSHGRPFIGLHTRIAQLETHHHARLAETLDACTTQSCSARDLVPILFPRPLDIHQLTFAMGEAIAHVHTLWFLGKLERIKDENGIYRFSAIYPEQAI
jgi:glyoxylase-like metal-dependent hydrolase (beta-lactamase superfamily II)